MSQGPDPAAANEFILRRIHKNHCDLSQPIPVSREAFRPSRDDADGLSVFLERPDVTPAEIAAAGRKPGEYYVVRISVQALQDLQLTLRPDELPGGPAGHHVVPELSLTAYQANKQRLKDVQLELAKLSSKDIVHHPDP
jgi:hypothetical protein